MDLIDLQGLTVEERNIILNVIRRDEELRQRQDNRISELKQELHNLRMNGVLRSGDNLSKMCARCKNPFGFFVNTGENCPVCKFRVCKNCKENLLTQGWMCTLCFKENQLQWLTGDWMQKEEDTKHKTEDFRNGTDLVRASLRVKRPNGNLGGLEERAGHSNNPSRTGTATASARPGQYSSPSQDTKAAGISGLFDSIRSGLGGGGADDEADSGAVGGGARPPGCGVVVQHVSCRRRRDSGSSADSDSDSQAKSKGRGGGGGVTKKAYSETNGMASQPLAAGGGRGAGGRTKGRAEAEESLGHSLGHDSGEHDARFSTLSHSQSSEASASTVKERGMGRRGNGDEDGKLPVAKPRPNHQARKSDLPVKREGRSQRREGGLTGPVPGRHNASDTEQRPSSSCSFTSSEWGEVTPSTVDSLPSLHDQPSPLDRKDEVGSAVGTSSGYASASRRSIPDIGDGSTNHSSPQHNNNHNHHQHNHKGSPSPAKSKSPASKLPVLMAFRRDSKSSLNQEPASSSQAEPHHQTHQPTHQAAQHQSRNNNNTATARTAAQTLVRRQSSGRSETLSLSSAKTASPITKMRLLDLASNRALERDGSDSVQSWSGGSDDTMSLGMSCSGVPTDAPVFQKVHYSKQHRKGSHDAPESQQISSNLNKSRQSDGDFTGASDQSDGGGASPMRPSSKASGGGGGGGTPKRSSSHLSTPSVVATSHTGSTGEKSVDDDDNIDELFAKHLPGSRLGISRSSIGSSRESLASVYSDAGEINYGRIPVTGDITFSLVYDVKCSALRVHIKGCHDLAPVDTKHNRSDPYVKVYLLPDKTRSGKRKTKIKKHTLNPVFDETLSYHISQGELENRTLWVTVWHSDRFGRNDFLGEVTIPLDVHRFDDTAFCTYDLESRMPEEVNETAMQYKGELVVSLMYVTPDKVEDGKKSKSKSKKSKAAVDPKGEVHAMIKAANNLTAVRSNGSSDPFVKGYLLPDQRRTGKQKTPVVKNSVNPMWNHILVFDGIDPMELADRSLELTVWDHEKLGTNEFLGGVRLNLGQGVVKGGHQVDWMDARGEEAITWQSMMERPNTWINAKLPLRASMGKSSTKK